MYRILQTGPKKFIVQRKGLLWGWNHYSYTVLGMDIVPAYFETYERAVSWLRDELQKIEEDRKEREFKPKVLPSGGDAD